MINASDVRHVMGQDLADATGLRVGRVNQVFLDAATSRPAWAVVATGPLGVHERVVPLLDATVEDGELHVPYPKDLVDGAPSVELVDGEIPETAERELYAYYGVPEGPVSHAPEGSEGEPPAITLAEFGDRAGT